MAGNTVEQLVGDINAEIPIVITNAFDIEICIREATISTTKYGSQRLERFSLEHTRTTQFR